MIVGIICIILISVLMYISRKEECECNDKYLRVFYRCASYIYHSIYKSRFKKRKNLKSDNLNTSLQALNPGKSQENCKKEYYVKKIAYVLMTIGVSSILAIIVWISSIGNEKIENGIYIDRRDYGEGTSQKEVVATIEDSSRQQLTVDISERKYSEEEINNIFDEIESKLPDGILGNNIDLEHIIYELNLPKTSSNYPVEIQWFSKKSKVINSDGIVMNEDLISAVDVELRATLIYEEYERECYLIVRVLPREFSQEQKIKRDILTEIERINQGRETEKNVILPTEINGKNILWKYKKESKDVVLIILGILAGIIIYFGKDKEVESEVKKREKELLMDYPEIVSKLTLLLGAGMTMRGAWEKIVRDYINKKQGNDNLKRYAYEEMVVTYYEIQNGVSEIKAYEKFGKRCCNQRYLKMSAIITQNLKKGSKGLSNMLQIESNAAYEDRKAFAKIAGEEAGTKLMGPMGLMLVVVMILIIVPAVSTF